MDINDKGLVSAFISIANYTISLKNDKEDLERKILQNEKLLLDSIKNNPIYAETVREMVKDNELITDAASSEDFVELIDKLIKKSKEKE